MLALPQKIRASTLADQLGLPLVGEDLWLETLAPLEEAEAHSLSFLQPLKKTSTKAGLLLAPAPVEGCSTLVCADPLLRLLPLLEAWFPEPPATYRQVGGGMVADGAVIGSGVRLDPGVVVGPGCVIGDQTVLFPNVVLMHGVRLGRACRIHANSVIGADGFRYHPGPTGPLRVPQVGGVLVGNEVELGAGCTIDRGFLGDTRLGDGCKLDNLVHIAHNCVLGKFVIIAAQTGLAGSCRIGDGVQIGGQGGMADHSIVGAGARIGAQSGVHGEVPAGETWLGTPARPISEMRRIYASLPQLPALLRRS
ncbi:MAG TPA: UDP-3-O-(3-hydroxymyristoyl)glucosamine N-acyltransferase [Myxococcota bacterium]|nr:UDP-3-O-(3-hydroxymyristoyl)glucosamine N-acyltransferase [Myxococcota bacterium]